MYLTPSATHFIYGIYYTLGLGVSNCDWILLIVLIMTLSHTLSLLLYTLHLVYWAIYSENINLNVSFTNSSPVYGLFSVSVIWWSNFFFRKQFYWTLFWCHFSQHSLYSYLTDNCQQIFYNCLMNWPAIICTGRMKLMVYTEIIKITVINHQKKMCMPYVCILFLDFE